MKKYKLTYCFTNGHTCTSKAEMSSIDEVCTEIFNIVTGNKVTFIPGPDETIYINPKEIVYISITEVKE